MKIYRKKKELDIRKAQDAHNEDTFEEELEDLKTIALTEEEVLEFRNVLPTLMKVLPKMEALLNGEASIEIIEDEDEEVEVEEDLEDVEEDIEEVEENIEDEKEDKAEDNSTFNADEILKDPAKRAALEKALANKPKEEVKAGDIAPEAPKGKVYVKRTLTKKAKDNIAEKVKKAGDSKFQSPNASLVNNSVKAFERVEKTEIKTFDFHKRGK